MFHPEQPDGLTLPVALHGLTPDIDEVIKCDATAADISRRMTVPCWTAACRLAKQSRSRQNVLVSGELEGGEMSEQKKNPLVGIAAVIGGISLCIVAVVAIFAKAQLMVAVWVVAALAVMGIGLGFFAARGPD